MRVIQQVIQTRTVCWGIAKYSKYQLLRTTIQHVSGVYHLRTITVLALTPPALAHPLCTRTEQLSRRAPCNKSMTWKGARRVEVVAMVCAGAAKRHCPGAVLAHDSMCPLQPPPLLSPQVHT